MNKKMVIAAAAASFMAAGANAQTVNFGPGDPSPGTGYTVINEFTSLSGLSVNDASLVQIKTPPSDGNGAVPANSFPTGSSYLSVLGGGSATYSLAGLNPRNIQFDWGSIDSYNTLTVNTVNGLTHVIVPGTATFPNAANGNQFADGTNGLFTLMLSNDRVSSVTFASSSNSFELDRFAISGAVPEPATWALMIMGFGAVGGAMRRRSAVRTNVSFA